MTQLEVNRVLICTLGAASLVGGVLLGRENYRESQLSGGYWFNFPLLSDAGYIFAAILVVGGIWAIVSGIDLKSGDK